MRWCIFVSIGLSSFCVFLTLSILFSSPVGAAHRQPQKILGKRSPSSSPRAHAYTPRREAPKKVSKAKAKPHPKGKSKKAKRPSKAKARATSPESWSDSTGSSSDESMRPASSSVARGAKRQRRGAGSFEELEARSHTSWVSHGFSAPVSLDDEAAVIAMRMAEPVQSGVAAPSVVLPEKAQSISVFPAPVVPIPPPRKPIYGFRDMVGGASLDSLFDDEGLITPSHLFAAARSGDAAYLQKYLPPTRVLAQGDEANITLAHLGWKGWKESPACETACFALATMENFPREHSQRPYQLYSQKLIMRKAAEGADLDDEEIGFLYGMLESEFNSGNYHNAVQLAPHVYEASLSHRQALRTKEFEAASHAALGNQELAREAYEDALSRMGLPEFYTEYVSGSTSGRADLFETYERIYGKYMDLKFQVPTATLDDEFKQLEKKSEYLRHKIRFMTEHRNHDGEARTHMQQARLYQMRGEPEDALEYLEEVLFQEPLHEVISPVTRWKVNKLRFDLALEESDFKMAERALKEMRALPPLEIVIGGAEKQIRRRNKWLLLNYEKDLAFFRNKREMGKPGVAEVIPPSFDYQWVAVPGSHKTRYLRVSAQHESYLKRSDLAKRMLAESTGLNKHSAAQAFDLLHLQMEDAYQALGAEAREAAIADMRSFITRLEHEVPLSRVSQHILRWRKLQLEALEGTLDLNRAREAYLELILLIPILPAEHAKHFFLDYMYVGAPMTQHLEDLVSLNLDRYYNKKHRFSETQTPLTLLDQAVFQHIAKLYDARGLPSSPWHEGVLLLGRLSEEQRIATLRRIVEAKEVHLLSDKVYEMIAVSPHFSTPEKMRTLSNTQTSSFVRWGKETPREKLMDIFKEKEGYSKKIDQIVDATERFHDEMYNPLHTGIIMENGHIANLDMLKIANMLGDSAQAEAVAVKAMRDYRNWIRFVEPEARGEIMRNLIEIYFHHKPDLLMAKEFLSELRTYPVAGRRVPLRTVPTLLMGSHSSRVSALDLELYKVLIGDYLPLMREPEVYKFSHAIHYIGNKVKYRRDPLSADDFVTLQNVIESQGAMPLFRAKALYFRLTAESAATPSPTQVVRDIEALLPLKSLLTREEQKTLDSFVRRQVF